MSIEDNEEVFCEITLTNGFAIFAIASVILVTLGAVSYLVTYFVR